MPVGGFGFELVDFKYLVVALLRLLEKLLLSSQKVVNLPFPKLEAFLGTAFDRPEDLEIKTLRNGKQQLYVATTTNNKVFSIDLRHNVVKLFASKETIDMATGYEAGQAFQSPDNLAIDEIQTFLGII